MSNCIPIRHSVAITSRICAESLKHSNRINEWSGFISYNCRKFSNHSIFNSKSTSKSNRNRLQVSARSFQTTSSLSATPSPSLTSQSASGPIDFILADIGEGIAECEVLRWYCKPGDEIQQFDRVCEVQSDKANVEITSRYDGKVIKLCVKEGELAKVGHPLMIIDVKTDGGSSEGEAATSSGDLMTGEDTTSAPVSASPVEHSNSHVSALNRLSTSPAVRRIAKEEGIDLTKIIATGPAGRILKEDVMKYVREGGKDKEKLATVQRTTEISHNKQSHTPVHQAPIHIPTSISQTATHSSSSLTAHYSTSDSVHPISGLQRIMVQTMTTASAVPHFTFADEYNVDSLHQLRSKLKPTFESKNIKLTFLPFFIKAVSLTLRDYPQLNAHTNADCTALTHKAQHNIGLAMDTPRGLLVPNIKNVQSLSIMEIASEIQRLTGLGKSGKLGRDDLTGGTITLSNIGSIGGTYMSPILVLPEVVIGAIGSIRTLPRFDQHGQVKAVRIMNVSWSGDHRVVDGATMARFSAEWKKYIEEPERMVVQMR